MHYIDPQFLIQTFGLLGIFAIIFAESGLFFGFFLPGDSLIFTAGLLASQGYLSVWWLFAGCAVAAILGDNVGYTFGKKVGPKLFKKEDSLLFNRKNVSRSEAFFKKYGKKAIILARFTPIVRTFTPILAGVGRMEYKTFLAYNIIGGLGWTALASFGGFYFGKLIPNPDRYILPVIAAIVILSIIPSLITIWREKKQKKS